MLSPIVGDVQRQRCCKRGSGDGQRLSLDYGTTERSFNAVERRGSCASKFSCSATIVTIVASSVKSVLEFFVNFR